MESCETMTINWDDPKQHEADIARLRGETMKQWTCGVYNPHTNETTEFGRGYPFMGMAQILLNEAYNAYRLAEMEHRYETFNDYHVLIADIRDFALDPVPDADPLTFFGPNGTEWYIGEVVGTEVRKEQ